MKNAQIERQFVEKVYFSRKFFILSESKLPISLKWIVSTNCPVDWSGRCEDSCGSTGLGRPLRSEATRRLSVTTAESEAPGTQINSPVRSQYINNIQIYEMD
jgi:hypothetical protein